jgi:hypothetical protein
MTIAWTELLSVSSNKLQVCQYLSYGSQDKLQVNDNLFPELNGRVEYSTRWRPVANFMF